MTGGIIKGNGSKPEPQPSDFFRIGDVYAQQGKYEDAARFILLGLQLNPENAEGYNNLGVVLHELKRDYDALACYERAISIKPQYGIALNNFGVALASLNRHHEAMRRYEEALAVKPCYAEALNNLGVTLHALKHDEEAVLRFEQALNVRPTYLEATTNLANTLKALSRFDEAIIFYRKAISNRPSDISLNLRLAACLSGAEKHSEAIQIFEQIIMLEPGYADAHAGLGSALQEVGHIEKARSCFERSIAIDPRQPSYYRGWALNSKVDVNDPILTKMLELTRELPSLNELQQIHLHFALGKALADIGKEEQAFDHLLVGNALRRRQIIYNETEQVELFDQTAEVFNEEHMQKQSMVEIDSAVPIFIVGMPRSGSTLLEQILSSHPNVVAGGELRTLDQSINEVLKRSGGSKFPKAALTWTPSQMYEIANLYLQSLDKCLLAEGQQKKAVLRVTDKRLDNFFFIGAIKFLFPKARIIHTHRDPIDTCLSCFSLFFETTDFSYDLGELGRRYRAYQQLMCHWHAVLPPGSILDVKYENVVQNTEAEVRRLLAYCGLEWDDSCLSFYLASRPVRTASVIQVRQPIYAKSVGKWQPKASVLDPLLKGLGHL